MDVPVSWSKFEETERIRARTSSALSRPITPDPRSATDSEESPAVLELVSLPAGALLGDIAASFLKRRLAGENAD
jgi:hypothetical protein